MKKQANTLPQFCRAKLEGVGPIRKSMSDVFTLRCHAIVTDNTLPQFCKAKLEGVGQHVKR